MHNAQSLFITTLLSVAIGAGATAHGMQASDHAPKTASGRLFEAHPIAINVSAGTLTGEATERVYIPKGGVAHKESELVWDLSELYMVGISASVLLTDWLQLSASYWTKVGFGSGQMTDTDWSMSEDVPGGDWTDWSLSDVDVISGQMLDIRAAIQVLKRSHVRVQGLMGYKQDAWNWEDYGLRHIYSVDGGFRNDIGKDDEETGVTYEQSYEFPYVGANISFRYTSLDLTAYVLYSSLVEAQDIDEHLFTETRYVGDYAEGDYLGFGVRGTYQFNDRAKASVAFDSQTMDEIIGDTTLSWLDGSEPETLVDGASTEHESWMLSLSLGTSL